MANSEVDLYDKNRKRDAVSDTLMHVEELMLTLPEDNRRKARVWWR